MSSPATNTDKTKPEANQLRYTLAHFNQDLSNNLYDAWQSRSAESPLYLFYNLIYSTVCTTYFHPDHARVSIGVCPQPLFGTFSEVATKNKLFSSKKNLKLLPRHQTPDFARLFIYSERSPNHPLPAGIPSARGLVDFQEIKVLNTAHPWWTEKAQEVSGRAIKEHLLQIFEAAMAGFAHNPDWERVHAVLLIGPFFTHFAWTSRPTEAQLAPIKLPHAPKNGQISDKGKQAIIDTLLDSIPKYQARALPDKIYFYNRSVVRYPDLNENSSSGYQDVCLSPEFLWTLSSPVSKHYPDIRYRSSMFSPPHPKPRISSGESSGLKKLLHQVIIDEFVDKAHESLHAMGHGNITPSPPTSVDRRDRYKPSGSTKAARDKSPPQTRARAAAEPIPGIED